MDYQFLAKESQVSHFAQEHIRNKTVSNVGTGLYHNGAATRSSGGSGQITRHDIHLMGTDMFADLPIANTNMALTLYAVYYHFDFGPIIYEQRGFVIQAYPILR